MYVLGCDPGKMGAIVAVSDDGRPLRILRTPHMKSKSGKGEEILYAKFWQEFDSMFISHTGLPFNEGYVPVHIFIERVHSMPNDGAIAAHKFGYSAGFLRGMIAASKIPYDMVEPQAWKKSARLALGSDKASSIPRACELWPKQVEELTPKRTFWTKEECIGVCDAALIGYHGLTLLGKAPVSFAAENPFDL